MIHSPEILAPAGNMTVFEAALNAGTDAVYLGLKSMNARCGAKNLSLDELKKAAEMAHANDVKVYLTLNTDLSQRELNQALRAVQYASDIGVDAILVKESALLALKPHFSIPFHFSTQAAISSSAGIAAAKRLGISRCVLARELSASEISACVKAGEGTVETEVFVQGALCFSVSGRCMLSSWVGGRSGNRGCCASPCRVGWSANEEQEGCTPFSMHDLSLSEAAVELRDIGVSSLKIEGRLKSPAWVTRAVTLFRSALSGQSISDEALGNYTGRRQTAGYYREDYTDLTGQSGRIASIQSVSASVEENNPDPEITPFTLKVSADEKGGILFCWAVKEREETFRLPPRPVVKAKKAMRLEDMAHGLLGQVPSALGTPVLNMETDPNQEFTPSAYTQVERAFSIFLRQAQKEPDTTIRYPISDEVKALFATSGICETNRLKLGVFPNRVRLDAACAALFAVQYPNIPMIISCFSVEEAKLLHGSLPQRARWVAALPTVIYEEDIPAVEVLLRYCHQHKVPVEVNSWDTWDLVCRLPELSMEAGPGLAVLNAVAARELSLRGCASVMISSEADAKQIADLCAAAETPLSLTVFGRPPLFISRVPLPECAQNEILSDSRGCRIKGRTEGRLSVYRPLSPYNWCDIRNDSIRVQHLVADLCASPDPVREYGALQKGIKDQTRFNFDRTLR